MVISTKNNVGSGERCAGVNKKIIIRVVSTCYREITKKYKDANDLKQKTIYISYYKICY